jgi:Dolichyl-phosphate-mannose-protein mannosyltransferase
VTAIICGLVRSSHARIALALITLAGCALRLYDLNGVPPRWDEGWSIAHAALPVTDVLRITAQDVHPPLYYLLLGLWQMLAGPGVFAARLLSVMLASTAVPLAWLAARAWTMSRGAALLAAGFMAWLPLAVYYGGVVRMYSLAPSFVLLAIWAAARMFATDGRANRWPATVVFAIGAAGAMYTLYHAVWALAGLGVWVVLRGLSHRLALRRLLSGTGLALLLYAPWAVYGLPRLLGRASAETTTNTNQARGIGELFVTGARELMLTPVGGEAALGLLGLILVLGTGALWLRRGRVTLMQVALPVLMIGLTLLGVAIAARQWAFNARMLVCAIPALALWLGMAIDGIAKLRPGQPSRGIAAFAVAALALAWWPVTSGVVYAKSLEVFDAYNPRTYRDNLSAQMQSGDAVFFNVLSPAGFFASEHQPADPRWSFALTWDPVREPAADWQARVVQASRAHDRLWIVLYRGLAGDNGELRGFMDTRFYPAYGRWGDEAVFYGLYGVADDSSLRSGPGATWPALSLVETRYSPPTQPGGIAAVALTWSADAPITRDYKVFVHVTKPDGFVIGQHDAGPINDLRPFSTLTVGERLIDRHGVIIPSHETGPLRIVVGVYDPATGERLRTRDGQDSVVIAEIP